MEWLLSQAAEEMSMSIALSETNVTVQYVMHSSARTSKDAGARTKFGRSVYLSDTSFCKANDLSLRGTPLHTVHGMIRTS